MNWTFICLREPREDSEWTIYHVMAAGEARPILRFSKYLDAARTLRFLRQSKPLNEPLAYFK